MIHTATTLRIRVFHCVVLPFLADFRCIHAPRGIIFVANNIASNRRKTIGHISFIRINSFTGMKCEKKTMRSNSLFSESPFKKGEKAEKDLGRKKQWCVFFVIFLHIFALNGSKKVERSCFLSRNILRLAKWRESKPCPATKSGNPTFLSRKAQGLDRVYPILQRNRGKKPSRNEKKPII